MSVSRYCDETGNKISEGFTVTSDFRNEWAVNERKDFGDIDGLLRWAIRQRAKYAGFDAVDAAVEDIKQEFADARAKNLCGGVREMIEPHVLLTSSPPQRKWKCQRCNAISYHRVGVQPGTCDRNKHGLPTGQV